MNILVIRFRQMGDAILATSLLNTLRHNFPEAQIHFVLNEQIAPLFEGHPSIDRIITFSEKVRHNLFLYLKKVWQTVHQTHYDVIIDMRSTNNTQLFALFSPRTPFRIGLKRWYTRLAFNHFITPNNDRSIVEHDVRFAEPLNAIKPIQYIQRFTLHVSDEEKEVIGNYLQQQGIDISKPIMLINPTAKLASKIWNEERMVWVLRKFIDQYPHCQFIFNYAPGQEADNARRIYEKLGKPRQVFIDVQARSSRELAAMSGYISFFFGNEGGARHIMHAGGCPSLVICAPESKKVVWIPKTGIPAEGIAPSDFASSEELATMSREEQYALIKQEPVWQMLKEFVNLLDLRKR